MTVDTDKKHYVCTKCGDVTSLDNSARNTHKCAKGNLCNWKIVQPHFKNTLPGKLFGLIFKK